MNVMGMCIFMRTSWSDIVEEPELYMKQFKGNDGLLKKKIVESN